MDQRYIDLSKDGKTKEMICMEFDISRETLNEWRKSNKSFSDACKKGDTFRDVYYQQLGLMIASGKVRNSNAGVFVWMTKQICNWKDQPDEPEDEETEVSFNFKKHVKD